MLFSTRSFFVATFVVLIHGGIIFALATAQAKMEQPEIIPIAILGSLVVAPAKEKPSDGALATATLAENLQSQPVPVKPVPEPVQHKPEPPKPELPRPVPIPEPTPRPMPKPEPKPPTPKPELKPAPVQQIDSTSAIAEQSSNQVAASQGVTGSSGSSGTPATSGVASGSADAVVAPSFSANYLRNPAPAYPAMSRRLQEEGKVLLRVLISADGKAKQVELKRSSGHKRLDDAALSTVKRWRFVPAKRGNTSIEMWYDVPISFSLKS